jgi:hypothetical protein
VSRVGRDSLGPEMDLCVDDQHGVRLPLGFAGQFMRYC